MVYVDGVLYEGTGLNGESTLRRVDLETGEVLQSGALDPEYFGEGIAVLGDRIYQLTWQTDICFVYDRETFELLDTFTYPTRRLGPDDRRRAADHERRHQTARPSATRRRSPSSATSTCTTASEPVANLNELEYVDGEVWANVWQTDRIARIDPETGQVTGWIDLTGLLPEEDRDGAGRSTSSTASPTTRRPDRLFVTGKLWPKLFEIEVVPRA